MASNINNNWCTCNIVNRKKIGPGNYSDDTIVINDISFMGENNSTCNVESHVVHRFRIECNHSGVGKGIGFASADTTIFLAVFCVILIAAVFCLFYKLKKLKKENQRLRDNVALSTS